MTSQIALSASRLAVMAALTVSLAAPAAAQGNPEPFRFLRPALGAGEGGEPPAPAAPSSAVPPAVEAQSGVPDDALPEAPIAAEAPAPEVDAAVSEGASPAAPEIPADAGAPAASTPDGVGSFEDAPPPPEDSSSIVTLPGEPEPIAAPLRFGIIAGRDLARTLRAVAPLEAGLAEATGRAVEFLPMATYNAMIDAQAAHLIDGGFYSGVAFAFAEAGCSCLDPLVAPAAADDTLAYHAIVAVRAGSPIRSPEDLAGRSVAAGPEDSLGARRMQVAGLAGEGIAEADFLGEVRDAGSAQAAVRLLLAGEVDAAFAWTSLAGEAAEGYSRGTFADLVALGELDMARIRIVWTSAPITHGPFAVSRALPAAMRRAVEDYFLGLRGAEPAAYDALNPLYGGGYRLVGRQDFAGLGVLAVAPADAAPAAAVEDAAGGND